MSMGGYFQSHFPGMKPINAAPNLANAWGTGFMMYGARDRDAGSGTYIATRFLTLLFVPMLAIDAYRVADAPPSGWFFLGKVPLTNTTRIWNVAFVLAVLVAGLGGAWTYHSTRPDTIQANLIAAGDSLAAQGKVGAAAKKYFQACHTPGATSNTAALDKLGQLFDGSLDQADGAELAEAVEFGVESFRLHEKPAKIYDVALQQAKKRADADGPNALKILNAIEPIATLGDLRALQAKKPILEKMIAADPDNLDVISDLAAVYESEKLFEKCEKLLAPRRDKLGKREGARILGQILLNKGEFAHAEALLRDYTEDRLVKLQSSENEFKEVIKRVQDRVVNDLKNNRAKDFDMAKAKALQHNAQNKMVNEYITKQLLNDPEFKRVQAALRSENRVASAAFDLGMAQLRLAQGIAGEGRRTGLEKAEKTFLRLRGLSGHEDESRMRLGQVYYWLGKPAEGRKLFDEVLQAQNRSVDSILGVANTLREVGSVAEARQILDDAHDKETSAAKKDDIARSREAMATDTDDRIKWLGKIHTRNGFDNASLAMANGDKAHTENRDTDAEKHYREALKHYAGEREDYAQLNNSALTCVSLYYLTSDPKDMNECIIRLEKAVALQARDSIVTSNAARYIMANALREVVGNEVDSPTLKGETNMDLIAFLYRDKATKDQYRTKIRQHEGVKKARGYYERASILAPRNAHQYGALANHYFFLQDRDELFALLDRVGKADLDLADSERLFKESREGTKKDKLIKDLQSAADAGAKRLEAARKIGGATLAVSLCRQVRNKVSLQLQGRPVDNNEMVSLADEAYKVAPSYGTQTTLIDALLARAHRDLIKGDPAYAATAKNHAHWLGARYLIAIALGKDGATQNACLANPDVQRACAILKQQSDTYDEEFNEWTWAMLRKIEPEWTAQKVKQWQKNDLLQASRAITRKLGSASAVTTYQQYWGYLMQGQQADADELMRKNAAQGLPTTK